MTSKLRIIGVATGLVVLVCGSVYAGKKTSAKHVAVGTIASIDAQQVVLNEKVKGKEQPVVFQLDSVTQKSGNLSNGALVTVQYHAENNHNIADTVRERSKQ